MPTFAETVIDNIALEGLEGVTLPTLWIHLAPPLHMTEPLPEHIREDIWSFLKQGTYDLEFFELPVERPPYKPINRLTCIDPELGIPISEKNEYPPRYKNCPIDNGVVKGSCEFFKERKKIPLGDLTDMSVQDVMQKWGEKFVIVASQDLRYHALTPINATPLWELTIPQYIVLESIGRSRWEGEATNGPYSLLNFCKDSTIVYYIKNYLLEHGLVAVENFHELRANRVVANTVITLPRFRRVYASRLVSIIEQLFLSLMEAPDHKLPLKDALAVLSKTGKNMLPFKKFSTTHHFRRLFETRFEEYQEKDKPVNVKMLVLRNPNMSMEKLFHDETEQDDEVEFLSCKHAYVDMPEREEIYQACARYGSRGLSQAEVSDCLGFNQTTVRALLKHICMEGLLKTYSMDRGRQRITMHVALEHFGSVQEEHDKTQEVLDSAQCLGEPNFVETEENPLPERLEIKASLKPLILDMEVTRRGLTQRQLERRTMILQTISERCVVQFGQLRSSIQQLEKEKGHTDEVCQKSVRRLLALLHKANMVCLYGLQLDFDAHTRLYNFATHPKIDIEHVALQREITKLKNNFFVSIEERRLKEATQLKRKTDPRATKADVVAEKAATDQNLLPINILRNSPKFLLSRYLHEFLFHIGVELSDATEAKPIDEPVLQVWQQTEPSLNIVDYLETLGDKDRNVRRYRDDIGWRTFVPPLPAYEGKPSGWVLFSDAVDRLPLSIFNQIFRLDTSNDKGELRPYLEHPVRQHYVLTQLPFDLRRRINETHMRRVYTSIMRYLNTIGLVQLAEGNRMKGSFWVYLNRRLQILDTTTTEVSYSKINPDRQYVRLRFELQTFEDVQSYWTTLQRVCVYTRLGFRGKQREKSYIKELPFLYTAAFADAPERDTGELVGDGRGAAGLASCLYAHSFRKWSWMVPMPTKVKLKRRPTKPFRTLGSAGGPAMRKNHTALVKSLSGSGRIVRRVNAAKGGGAAGEKRKKKPPIRDAIDRDALRNMRTLRVSWHKEEDNMLKMGRAVFNFLGAPLVTLFGLLAVGRICRDVMRRTLGTSNKTCQACVRRLHFIVKMNRHIPEVPTWMHMLQTSPEIQRIYGDDFTKTLRTVYPNRHDFGDALSKHFVNILYYLYTHVDKAESWRVPSFIIPDTVEAFHQQFSLQSTEEGGLMYSNPVDLSDVQVAMVLNVLHSSLCSSLDKTTYHLQAFEIYKHYSEEVLQRAFLKARSDALVVAIKRRHIQVIPTQLAGPAYLLSSKYRTRLIFLKIPYSMFDAYYQYFNECLAKLYGEKVKPSVAELKSPQLGQLFFLAECLSMNLICVNTKLPINILTVDAEQRQTLSPLDRILDHYHCIFDNAPQTEYIKNFENDSTERQVRVKFHPANLSYKLTYTPYDHIAKLPSRCLHFFCALDFLGQEVEINFNKLLLKDDVDGVEVMVCQCPFKCIMSSDNYMNEIERIVNEKRDQLVNLSEMAPQKLLNQALSDCSVRVESTNLLTLVRMLESFWHEKESANERKDFGKISGNLKVNKPVDWPETCLEILNYNLNEEDNDKNDEYEPTLNKEERIVRAQDVFVVNLPTITISEGQALQVEANKARCTYRKFQVPQVWINDSEVHANILQKIMDEAQWKYTQTPLRNCLTNSDFSAAEKAQLQLIHNLIKTHKLGIPVAELVREFPQKELLRRCLHFLIAEGLIKRVGISTFMYVHRDNIREWVVHTFHIKRLERENQGVSAAQPSRKRLHEDDNGDGEEVAEKKLKAPDGEKPKRKVKPPKRLNEAKDEETPSALETIKETVVMKPQPWIRLCGTLNRRVLDRWLGSILTECIARCGCSVHDICLRFPHMQPVDVMFLLEVLVDLKCIQLREIHWRQQTLLTEYEGLQEEQVYELYDPENTYATAEPDAVLRLTSFIGQKKYNKEFI